MARTKQLPHSDVAAATKAIDLSEDSGDDIVVEVEQPKASQQSKAKTMGAVVDGLKPVSTKPTTKTMNSALKTSKGKGKAKPDAEEDADMDVDTENLGGRKWPDHALVGPPSRDINVLRQENQIVRPVETCLNEENERLRLALDEVLDGLKPSVREEAMQAEIDSLNALVKRRNETTWPKAALSGHTLIYSTEQQRLLELRNSEYTKSRLINHDPAEPADWVTVDWAENLRDKAVAELTAQMEKLASRVEKAEKAKKDADREGAEARRELTSMQRELDAEVSNSKKLQAEIGRRPAASAAAETKKPAHGGGPGAYEIEKKMELFEGLTGLAIVSYVEAVRQPGNVGMLTYTCLLSVDNKEFPFKLVVWDERRPATESGEETEHVIYSPSEPLDPELELGYLKDSFTFPRSQMRVFYHNMINILTDTGEQEEEEEEEEE